MRFCSFGLFLNFTTDLFYHFFSTPRNGILCDVRLVVDEMEIPVHKAVLVAASPYFHAMFTSSQFIEAQQDKVIIHGVDFQVLQTLVEYVYTGCIQLKKENVQVTQIAIHFYGKAIEVFRKIHYFSLNYVIIVMLDSSRYATDRRFYRAVQRFPRISTRTKQLPWHSRYHRVAWIRH